MQSTSPEFTQAIAVVRVNVLRRRTQTTGAQPHSPLCDSGLTPSQKIQFGHSHVLGQTELVVINEAAILLSSATSSALTLLPWPSSPDTYILVAHSTLYDHGHGRRIYIDTHLNGPCQIALDIIPAKACSGRPNSWRPPMMIERARACLSVKEYSGKLFPAFTPDSHIVGT